MDKFGLREDMATPISSFFQTSGIFPDVLVLLLSGIGEELTLVAKKVVGNELVE